MGALQELISLLRKVDPLNLLYQKKQLASAGATDESNNDYNRKLQLIKSSLYGIDIQPIAIQICKLRFFISLIVEQGGKQKESDNLGILALPNLETKFVAADTLKSLQKPGQATFEDDVIDSYLHQLRIIRNNYFNEHDPNKKFKLRRDDKKLRANAAQELRKAGWSAESSTSIEHDIYNQHDFVPWFDPAMLFGLKEGYDLVIGNPPYISLLANKSLLGKRYKGCGYHVFSSRGDIYQLFYERSLQLLEQEGLLCFITSNQWMRATYGKKMRKYLSLTTNALRLINLGSKVFDAAAVDTNILLVRKNNGEGKGTIPAASLVGEENKDISRCKFDKQIIISADNSWLVLNAIEQSIKNKMESAGVPLLKWGSVDLFMGIATGCDKAFVIAQDKYNNLPEELRAEMATIVKPALFGKDIDIKYLCPSPKHLLLYFPRHFPFPEERARGVARQAEQEFAAKYPLLYAYLSEHRSALEKRSEADRHEWYELLRARDSDKLDRQKIVWPEIARIPKFAWASEEVYILGGVTAMVGRDLLYLLGVLNSRAVQRYIQYTAAFLGDEAYRLKPQFAGGVPVPLVAKAGKQAERITDLVKEAIKLTQAGKDITQIEQKIDEEVFVLYGLKQKEKNYLKKLGA